MNQTQYVEQITSWSDLEQDKRIGKVTFEGVDHFYNMEKLGEVLYENYEYYILILAHIPMPLSIACLFSGEGSKIHRNGC